MSNTPEDNSGPRLSSHRLVSNTLIYFVGQLLSWTVTFISVSIIPRRLGEAAMGQLALASAAVGTVGTVCALSIEQYIATEAATGVTNLRRFLGAAVGMRLAIMPVMICLSLLVFRGMHASPTVWLLGWIGIVSMCLGYISGPMRWVLLGWDNARGVALSDLMLSFAPLATIPFLKYGPVLFALINLIGAVPSTCAVIAIVMRRVRPRPIVDLQMWKQLVRGSTGFMANDLVTPFYAFTSIFLLKHFTSESVVGVYSQSQKLLGTSMFVPAAIGAALLPSLTRLADVDKREFLRMYRIVTVVVILGLPVTVLALMLATPFCHLLYGVDRFKSLPVTVQACGLTVIPLYVTTILYRFVVAQRKSIVWAYFMLGTVVLNGILCCFLIPLTQRMPMFRTGTVGAVLASALAETCSSIFALAILNTGLLTLETAGRLARGVFAAVLMALAMWATRGLFFVFTAIIGLATFGVVVWVTKALGEEEQKKLAYMVRRKLRLA